MVWMDNASCCASDANDVVRTQCVVMQHVITIKVLMCNYTNSGKYR